MKVKANELAMKYLAYRSRTSHEMEKYLKSKEIAEEDISSCMMYLMEYNYINDEDYCKRFFIYSIEKGRGPLRITRDLREKGISDELIRTGIEENFALGGELKLAKNCVEKLLVKEFNDISLGEKEIGRIGRRLASLGYHSHIIYELLGKIREGLI